MAFTFILVLQTYYKCISSHKVLMSGRFLIAILVSLETCITIINQQNVIILSNI